MLNYYILIYLTSSEEVGNSDFLLVLWSEVCVFVYFYIIFLISPKTLKRVFFVEKRNIEALFRCLVRQEEIDKSDDTSYATKNVTLWFVRYELCNKNQEAGNERERDRRKERSRICAFFVQRNSPRILDTREEGNNITTVKKLHFLLSCFENTN